MLLIRPDSVDLYAAGTADTHGWVGGKGSLVWSGEGSLDTDPGTSNPTRSDGSTFQPITRPTGRLHLPETCPVVPGQVVEVRGHEWVVKTVQPVLGPYAGSPLDQIVCTVEAGGWWP